MYSAWRVFGLLFGVISASVAGCSGSGEGPAGPHVPNVPEARSSKQRLEPTAPSASVAQLAHSDAAFALDLLHAVHPDGNFFYSPHSLSIGLAMTYAGAAGGTKTEMQKALHFDQPDADLHAAFNSVDQALASRGKNAAGSDGQPFRLRVTNALWAQKGFDFLPSFLDVLGENYGAGVKLVDFENDSEGALSLINDWVSAMTEQKIPTLLGPSDIDDMTRLVLTNTVYFNASWDHSFKPEDTAPGAFTRADGSTVTVPLMHGLVGKSHGAGDGWEAAEIPYDGDEVSMLVIVPDPGTFAAFESAFDAQKLDEISNGLASPTADVYFTLPKLEIHTHANLNDPLAALGMPTAFSMNADFSAMDGRMDLYIKNVVHDAFVNVNEAGTEAAAATAVVISGKAVPDHIEVTSPFYFLIRDKATGVVVFMGRVVDPSAS